MNKLQLKKLLFKYRHEIKNGNMEHSNDLIATMVLKDLMHLNDHYLENRGIKKITLDYLLYGPHLDIPGYTPPKHKITIPSKEEIDIIKSKYIKHFRSGAIPYGCIRENAAMTWIDMMCSFGMIKEGQIIIPDDYYLSDFITDENLKTLLKPYGVTIHSIMTK